MELSLSAATFDRFRRLDALKTSPRRDASAWAELRGIVPDLPLGSKRLAELLGGESKKNHFGEYLSVRRWFSEANGCEPPSQTIDSETLELLIPSPSDAAADPSQWLFLDTETTGLAGGTGTYPFLIGIAWWDAGGLEVEQLFMRDHSEEHSILAALADRMAERRVLVTFNGKSFDWPLLETRFRMTRQIRLPAPRAHLDFLHPARNLWRLRLGSVRLAQLERHVLGWDRGMDVMSELIPTIYFEFLRGGTPDPLVPVFQHNQMDLRGLAALAAHVVALLRDPESRGRDSLEIFGVSRICERRGKSSRARDLYSQSLAGQLPEGADRLARKSLARLARRDGDFATAVEAWTAMLDSSREGLEAYEALAIYHERRTGEVQRAAVLVREALVELRRAQRTGILTPSVHKRFRGRFESRLARLEQKLKRTSLHTLLAESNGDVRESNHQSAETD